MNSIEEKKYIEVVIIDSGINASISDLKKYIARSTGFRMNESGLIIEDSNMSVKSVHGTGIALIIRSLCPNVRLYSINIFEKEESSDGRTLLHAFNEAINYKPCIIHLSIGTTKIRYWIPFKKAVKSALKNNIIVVSAADNNDRRSYPAYLNDVVGVKRAQFNNVKHYSYKNGFFYAPTGLNKVQGSYELERDIGGNSIAAAYITGHIANLAGYTNLNSPIDLINRLRQNAEIKTVKGE